MRVAISPAVPSDLPPGVSAAVVADQEIIGLYYARTQDVPVAQQCADASAALTAAFEIVLELERREHGPRDPDGEDGQTGESGA